MYVSMRSVKAWLNFFLSDSFLLISWADHLNSYWRQRSRENILILTYKEMIEGLPKVVHRIADFMGVKLTANEFGLVCKKSTFKYMQSIDYKFYPGALTPWSLKEGKMIRSGKCGNSSELLSLEQQMFIDNYCKDELQKLRCDFPYDEIWEV